MKKITFLFSLIFATFISVLSAQQMITVTDATGQNTKVFDVLDSAINNASDGDFVYLPGGGFNSSKVTVNKSIHIIGAGHRTDSARATGITMLSGNFVILNGGSNGSISGVYLTGDLVFGNSAENQNVVNYNISRCSMNQFQFGFYASANNPNARNINVSECVFRGPWNYNCYAANVKIEKSIFNGRVFYYNNGAVFTNNIFLFRNGGWPVFNNSSNVLIYNNIIFQEGYVVYSSDVNEFHNNLFARGITAAQLAGQVLGNNVYNFAIDSIFVGIKSDDWYYSEGKDYHLQKYAIEALKGTDGTQVGIYGTAFPYKDGAMPVNPHITFKSIAPSTNPEGKIQVNIKVKAQSN